MKSVVRFETSPLLSKREVSWNGSVSSVDTYESVATPTCKCGKKCILYISKTSKNPNTHFFRCPYFKQQRPHCNFIVQKDKFLESQTTMVELQSKPTMVELLEAKINQLEKDVKVMKIKIENDIEVKITQLERNMEVKINQFERDIEVTKTQIIEMQVKMEDIKNWKRCVRAVGVVIVIWLYPFVFGSRKRLSK
ncbi:hypothetical protein TSUD_29050 [Trifolium subterraneum]|uniref:Zinc finger GRF-type domain-containing protein n=1 Tax=Trifolium subterraneum TaxID=3900 RepID=A0A2Z6NSL1_TRISU|nr:hypothetical protein TSUD_29050 [Trifolium subterraneum]